MELDIFFSICQTEVHGYLPSERVMFENFFEQVELADTLGFGSAIMNILCNGGPIAAAERVKTFLALHGLDENERRLLTVGFASGRFPFINIPYGIVPRDRVEEAAWPVMKNKIFEEATEIFL